MAKKPHGGIPRAQRRIVKPSDWCKGRDARRRNKGGEGKVKALETRWSKT